MPYATVENLFIYFKLNYGTTMLISKSILLGAIVTACSVLTTASAFAQSANYSGFNKSIARVGIQKTGQGLVYFVGFVEPLGQNCQYDTIYVTSDRKDMYVQLLAAKLSNRRISRVEYSQPAGSGSSCNAEMVEIAD